jgi:transposase-like protein
MNNDSTTTSSRKRKRYDSSFKRSAVELWLSGGKSAEATAAELGISGQTLKAWKHQLGVAPPASATPSFDELQKENARLRRELLGAQRRCDILKKTLGILSEPGENALRG